MNDIFQNSDILQMIVKYLPLESKIILGKVTKSSHFRFYDFSSDDYKLKHLRDLFDTDIIDFYMDYNEIHDKYVEIQRREFVKNNLSFFDIPRIQSVYSNIPIEEFILKVQYSHSRWHTEFENECDEKLSDIIKKSIFDVRIKVLTQIIEDNNIYIAYDNSLDPYDIVDENKWNDEITKYYLQNIHNLDTCCSKCGVFGHDSLSKSCVFYSEESAKQELNREIGENLDSIINKVDIISARIAKNREKGLIGCKGKWCNKFSSYRCSFGLCKNCCKNNACRSHGN